jgi:hypothetical protein
MSYHRADGAAPGTLYALCKGRTKAALKVGASVDALASESKKWYAATVKCYTMAPNPTVLTLEVVAAKDLEAMDTGGTSDPYTVVQVAKETRKTKVIKKNLNPEWAETFELVVNDVNDTLKVSVWDKDLIDADDLIGETMIPLQDVVGKEVPQKWYTLYHESRVTGEIMLGIKLPIPEDPTEERILIEWARPEEEEDGVSAAQEKFYSQTQHQFNLESTREHDTHKLPSQVRTGYFVKEEEAARAFDEACAPDGSWNGRELNFSGQTKFIGMHVLDTWMNLSGDDGTSVIGVQAGVMTSLRVSLKIIDPRVNYLEIYLEGLQRLPKMDSGLGTCDAYCCIVLECTDDGGEVEETVFRSKVVRNSLDPEFGQMFRICVPPHQLEAKQGRVSCYVQVWDWDRYDEDDHIGTATVELKAHILKSTPCKWLYVVNMLGR